MSHECMMLGRNAFMVDYVIFSLCRYLPTIRLGRIHDVRLALNYDASVTAEPPNYITMQTLTHSRDSSKLGQSRDRSPSDHNDEVQHQRRRHQPNLKLRVKR